MKFLMFIAGIAFVVAVFLSVRVASARMACNTQFRPEIDRLVAQSTGVFGDKHKMCEYSFEAISQWDACFTEADALLPKEAIPVLSPVISTLMVFTQQEHKEIGAIKQEHDERCTDYPLYLFETGTE